MRIFLIFSLLLISINPAIGNNTVVKKQGSKVTITNDSKFIKTIKRPIFDCQKQNLCRLMTTCKEAYFYLNRCGSSDLDRDNDGIPCENICKK